MSNVPKHFDKIVLCVLLTSLIAGRVSRWVLGYEDLMTPQERVEGFLLGLGVVFMFYAVMKMTFN